MRALTTLMTLVTTICYDRSIVTRETCETLGYLSQTLGPYFDPFHIVLHELVAILRAAKKALTTPANECLTIIMKFTQTPAVCIYMYI